MTPGLILKGQNMHFLVLFSVPNDSRTICTVVGDVPYVNKQNIIDVVVADAEQWYLAPGIALLSTERLEKLPLVDQTDLDTILSLLCDTRIAFQISKILSK